MNRLPREKQIQVISALVEGCSIRATERMTDVHRDTIMRLGVRIGEGCEALHDASMRGLQVPRIELDEIWAYVGKKQRRTTPEDVAEKGNQYSFLAMDATGKAIISYRTGKRDAEMTHSFICDLRERVINAPEISSDGFDPYPNAIEAAFGADVAYGRIVKVYRDEPGKNAARRYSPGYVVNAHRERIEGRPQHISTSLVERGNLTLRMSQRRFTRLTNGFSKTLRNHKAAVSLYVSHYNFCRVHETTRITPAMALGVADHIWTIGELVEAASNPLTELIKP